MSKYGFNDNVYNVKNLVKIFDIIKDRYFIGQIEYKRYFVLKTKEFNATELKEIVELSKGLSKKYYTYTSKELGINNGINERIDEDTYYSMLQEYNDKKRKAQEEKDYKEKIRINTLEGLKRSFEGEWRDQKWIETHIGKYCCYDPEMEYYWSIIGDKYQVFKNSIKIDKDLYDKFKNDEISLPGLKGHNFINRQLYHNGTRRLVRVEELFSVKKEVNSCGVYGIYKNGNLIYIGSTGRNFEERFKEHQINMKARSKDLYVYSLFKEGDDVSFSILIDVMKLKTNRTITKRDIQSMELALIDLFQPDGNLAGKTYEFKYSEDAI